MDKIEEKSGNKKQHKDGFSIQGQNHHGTLEHHGKSMELQSTMDLSTEVTNTFE